MPPTTPHDGPPPGGAPPPSAAEAADTLARLGWTQALAQAFAELDTPGLVAGRCLLERGGFIQVHTGAAELSARVAGTLRHQAASAAELPVVGDWVALRPADASGGLASIRALLPRRSKLSRRAAGEENVEQVLAANVDTALLLMGLDADYNARRLERYLALVRAGGVTPAVVLSKADVVEPERLEACVAEVRAMAPGVAVHALDLKGPAVPGALAPLLRAGDTLVALGSSGVGKSTLVNRLLGREAQRTGEVRADDSRGRHTTSHRELFRLPEGALLIDTPGVRELQPWEALPTLEAAFPDLLERAALCRFRNCQHRDEPGCAVREAEARGEVPPERRAAFLKLHDELAAASAPEGGGGTKEGGRAPRRRKGR
jgi:ribosome biogenesis GTPase